MTKKQQSIILEIYPGSGITGKSSSRVHILHAAVELTALSKYSACCQYFMGPAIELVSVSFI